MEPKKKQKFRESLFWSIVVGLIIFTIWNIRLYLVALISAFILAYMVKPVYDRLARVLPQQLSAMLCIFIVIVIIAVPLGLIAHAFISQANAVLQSTDIRTWLTGISSSPLLEKTGISLDVLREKSIGLLVELLTETLKSIPSLLLNLLIIGFGMYYILIGWTGLSRALIQYIPFKNKEETAREIDTTTRALLFGTVLIAVIEFIVAALGFYLSGVPSSIFLAALIFIFAFLPGISSVIVWVPLALYYLFTAAYAPLIGVLITGLVISFGIEVLLRNKLMSENAKINPLVMLLGVFSGVSVFGIFGFIIGPLLLAYTLKLLEEGVKNA